MVLDNVTAEVSKKVKSAIKAKLTELGAYVDDELPDYIMILVGNKKTKDQMDDDLSLFLGHNTERFTSWLHNVLQKLNAASVLQKDAKPTKEKEKKKEEEKEKVVEVEVSKQVVEEKKKHKKKKDKSEKKKEKKEKKKKKDKEKEKHSKSQKNKEKERSKSKSKSPMGEQSVTSEGQAPTTSTIETNPSSKVVRKGVEEIALNVGVDTKSLVQESKISNAGTDAGTIVKEEEDLPDDVVDLRPDAEDLALGLEDEPPIKKLKPKSQVKESKEPTPLQLSQPQLTDIEIKVDNSGGKESVPKSAAEESEPEVSTSGVHDRLGATSSLPSTKRIINLREESSFPPKSSHGAEGMGRVVSNAIASAVKSVTVMGPKSSDGKTGKKLEARVRPLLSSRLKMEEVTDDVTPPPPPPPPPPPTRVVSTVGAVLKRSHSNDDSEESEEPSAKRIAGVASKVEVTPRPRRPGSMQANTALIVRAVADACKSVNKPNKKSLDEKEEEKNRKEIFTRSYQERQNQRLASTNEGKSVKKFAITVPNALLKDNMEMQISGKQTLNETYLDEIGMEEEYVAEEGGGMDHCVAEVKTRQEKVLPQPKAPATNKVLPLQVDDPAGSTRFIVTLDGFGNEASSNDLRSRLSGRPVRTPSVDEEEFIEEVEEWEEEVEEMEGVAPQGGVGQERVSSAGASFAPKWKAIDAPNLFTKKEERCRYWPACKEGASCQYIHPSKICKTFPNCRFGDKCIYIHPNCKFDSTCTKLNCPYTHASSRNLSGTVPVKPKAVSLKSKIKCRYYPKCVDMNCPFMHPKQICRYGKSCQTPSCLFVHPDVTTGALLKWTAPKQAASSSTTSTTTTAATTTSSVSTTTPTLLLNKPKPSAAAV